jgi:uncharacterized protein (TIGR03084 family)
VTPARQDLARQPEKPAGERKLSSMSMLDGLSADLLAEHEALDRDLAGIEARDWLKETPAEGWNVADQISHLAYFDATAALALVNKEAFARHKESLLSGKEPAGADVALGRSVPPDRLVADWRTGRRDLLDAISGADPNVRVCWYGPDMSLPSFTTARLMETWAHGQDVRDALGLAAEVSDRLRHICHIGFAARRYSYLVRGLAEPEVPVRLEVTAPSSSIWAWGPAEAAESVRGSALGVALVFTQRRHLEDTDVVGNGEAAREWLSIAQAFAGPPGTGRPPGLGMPVSP